MFFQEQSTYICAHKHIYTQTMQTSILYIIFQKKLAEKMS